MSVRLRIDASDLERIRKRVEGWEERAKDLSPVLKGRAEALVTTIKKDVFRQAQSPAGVQWRPLAEATVTKTSKRANDPLIDTGNLMRSITGQVIGRNAIRVGVSGAANKYAAVHQYGHRFKSGVFVPARPFIPTQADLDSSGPAGKWAERAKRRIVAWILQGKK